MSRTLALVAMNLRRGPARLGWLAPLAAVSLIVVVRLDLALSSATRDGLVAGLGIAAAVAVALGAGLLPALAASRMSQAGSGRDFLETLPVSRLRPFIADLLASIAPAAATVLALAGYPTVPELNEPWLPPLFEVLFASRVVVVAWAGGVAVLALGATFLARALTRTELQAVGLVLIELVGCGLLIDSVSTLTEVSPLALQSGLLLLVIGAIGAVLALIVVVVAPVHLDHGVRADGLRVTSVAAWWAIATTLALIGALRLAVLDASNVHRMQLLATDPEGHPSHLLLAVTSPQSEQHHLLIEIDSARVLDLGRSLGLPPPAEKWTASGWRDATPFHGDRLLLKGGRWLAGLFWSPAVPLLAFDLGGSASPVLASTIVESGGETDQLRDFAWDPAGRLLYLERSCLGAGHLGCRDTLVIHDHPRPDVRLRVWTADVDIPPGEYRSASLVVGAGRALVWTELDDSEPERAAARPDPEHLLVDLATMQQTHFRLAGRPVGLAADLGRALLVRGREDGGRRYDSLVEVTLPGLAERVILGEEVLPSHPVTATNSRKSGFESRPRFDCEFDAGLRQGVWLEARIEDGLHVFALNRVDVARGTLSPLIGTGELQPVPVLARDRFHPYIAAFAVDGSAATLAVIDGVLRVDLVEGTVTRLATGTPSAGRGGVAVSPGLRRVAWIQPDQHGYAVVTPGLPAAEAYAPSEDASVTWLDDSRLLIVEPAGRVLLFDSTSPWPRQLFPGSRP